ncbi:MAG: hypothetical protein R3E91_03400 [Chlamydiales bacterium]
MNQEISPLSGRLTSKPCASIGKTNIDKAEELEASQASRELEAFKLEIEKHDHAFSLVNEIRQSLEKALKNLSGD